MRLSGRAVPNTAASLPVAGAHDPCRTAYPCATVCPVLTRRGLLATAVLGALAGGSGCVRRDPTVGDTPVVPTVSSPPAEADLTRHGATQAALAAAAAGASALGGFRQRATDDLSAQAELLAPGASAPAAAGDFATACRAAASAHLSAVAQGEPAARLASAGAYAAALASLAGAGTPRVPAPAGQAGSLPAVDDAEAMTGLLLQLYPAVYALEAALPALADADRGWARPAMEGHLTARQELQAELGRRSLQVPAAEVAYETGRPAGPEDALALVARVEQAVLPAAARLVRASGEQGLRRLGGEVLADATVAVARAGGELPTWPGWA